MAALSWHSIVYKPVRVWGLVKNKEKLDFFLQVLNFQLFIWLPWQNWGVKASTKKMADVCISFNKNNEWTDVNGFTIWFIVIITYVLLTFSSSYLILTKVLDILELGRPNTPEVTKESIMGTGNQKVKPKYKPKNEMMKKPEGMARELFNLLVNDSKDPAPLFPTDTGSITFC